MPAKLADVKTTAVKKIQAKGAGGKGEAGKVAQVKAGADKKAANAAKLAAGAPDTDAGAGQLAVALRVKDLVDRVATAGDFKKKDVRDIVEATLAELGRALEAGQVLNLPPFGKLRVGRSRDLANGSMMTLKLRRVPAKTGGKKAEIEGLAAAGEAG